MNKRVKLLLIALIAILISTPACKNKSKQNFSSKKTSKDIVKSLDFSYFPAETTILAIVDFQSIFSVKAFQPLLKRLFTEVKKSSNLDLSELNSLSAFINIKDLRNNPLSNVAIILDGIDLSKFKKMPKAPKTEKFEGLNINIYDDNTGFVVIDKKTIGGTLVSVKNAISLNKGKSKNLASTPRNNNFKEIISKLNNSQLNLTFVSNEKTEPEIKKYFNKPQFFMLKTFIDNFKSAGFGIKIDNKNIDFILVMKSSKDGVKSLASLANTQLKQIKPNLDKQLTNLKSIVTQSGTDIVKNVIKTIKIEKKNEFLVINFKLTMKDAMKIPEIVMSLGLIPANRNLK